jgi:hypothetical protein
METSFYSSHIENTLRTENNLDKDFEELGNLDPLLMGM